MKQKALIFVLLFFLLFIFVLGAKKEAKPYSVNDFAEKEVFSLHVHGSGAGEITYSPAEIFGKVFLLKH